MNRLNHLDNPLNFVSENDNYPHKNFKICLKKHFANSKRSSL
jgi:hypothetical protein